MPTTAVLGCVLPVRKSTSDRTESSVTSMPNRCSESNSRRSNVPVTGRLSQRSQGGTLPVVVRHRIRGFTPDRVQVHTVGGLVHQHVAFGDIAGITTPREHRDRCRGQGRRGPGGRSRNDCRLGEWPSFVAPRTALETLEAEPSRREESGTPITDRDRVSAAGTAPAVPCCGHFTAHIRPHASTTAVPPQPVLER